MEKMISMIKSEAIQSELRYLNFFNETSKPCFMLELRNYFENKLYNFVSIDLIPLITANAIQMNVGIIRKDADGMHACRWVHCSEKETSVLFDISMKTRMTAYLPFIMIHIVEPVINRLRSFPCHRPFLTLIDMWPMIMVADSYQTRTLTRIWQQIK